MSWLFGLKYTGDMVHLASFIFLLYRIHKSRSTNGLSAKTQEIFLIVFLIRYVDICYKFISLYNYTLKIGFLTATTLAIFIIRYKKPYCLTYNKTLDSINYVRYILPLAAVLTLIFNSGYSIYQLSYSYSQWLEAFAIYPQIYILYKMKNVENITSHYVGALGLYRGIYLLYWILCWATSTKIHTPMVSIVAGTLQTLLYIDFFYYYLKSLKDMKSSFNLPI